MMKIEVISLLLLLAILVVVGTGCGDSIAKPTFNYLPEGWIISEDNPNAGETLYRSIPYGELRCQTEDFDCVTIWYGEVDVMMPPPFQGSNLNEEILIEIVKWASNVSDPEETGTMFIAGELAGYIVYKGWSDAFCNKDMVFIKGSTYVYVWSFWDCDNHSVEMEIEAIIEGITL